MDINEDENLELINGMGEYDFLTSKKLTRTLIAFIVIASLLLIAALSL